MNNKHLSWYKEINNNFIIASRAYFLHRASTQDTSRNTKPCAGNPDSSSLSSVIVFVVLRRSPAKIVLHQHRHHAVVLPELIYYFAPVAGSRRHGRHRAEHVQNSEVPCFRYLDRSDREDVRLHQPRWYNASTNGLRWYIDNTLPSHFYASPR